MTKDGADKGLGARVIVDLGGLYGVEIWLSRSNEATEKLWIADFSSGDYADHIVDFIDASPGLASVIAATMKTDGYSHEDRVRVAGEAFELAAAEIGLSFYEKTRGNWKLTPGAAGVAAYETSDADAAAALLYLVRLYPAIGTVAKF
jgi:hypothetical protein